MDEVTNETPETPVEETLEVEQEEKEVVLIDDQEVPWDSVVKAYQDMQNNQNWQASNTQKAQEIAAEKQRLEADKQYVEQLRKDAELLLNRTYQPQTPYQTQQAVEQQDEYFGLNKEEFEDLTTTEKMLLKSQFETNQSLKKFQEENARKEFYTQTQMEHQRLKSLYPDYDGLLIERTIIQGRNQFEDAYLADAYKKLKSGDANAIKSMIPATVMDEIKKEVRNQVIEEARKKEQMKSKLSTVSPDKPGLSKLPTQPAKNYNDVQKNVMQILKEKGLSLTT
jgi:hypothetical protein